VSAVVSLSLGVEGVDQGATLPERTHHVKGYTGVFGVNKKAHRRTGPQRAWTRKYQGGRNTHIRRTRRTSVLRPFTVLESLCAHHGMGCRDTLWALVEFLQKKPDLRGNT